ncbi:MAG: hypothetical protein OXF20_03425 [Gammaproteobacteria bacterium]|nr:hypothetical protein [Gammaproteobacteria bacterium]
MVIVHISRSPEAVGDAFLFLEVDPEDELDQAVFCITGFENVEQPVPHLNVQNLWTSNPAGFSGGSTNALIQGLGE